MTAIITRSALEFWGHDPAPDVSHVIVTDGQRTVVTWDEVMNHRRQRQAEIMRYKRSVSEWKLYKVWVAHFDQRLMGGWQAFIENISSRNWIDRDCRWLQETLRKLFPCTLLNDWEAWKVAFAQQYEKRRRDGRPVGVGIVRWDGASRPQLP